MPLFAALTEGADEAFRRRMALKAVLLAGTMFLLFAVGGAWFLRVMGISIEAFRIAGGIMLFLIALEMVFARESGTRADLEGARRGEEARGHLGVPARVPVHRGARCARDRAPDLRRRRAETSTLSAGLFGVVAGRARDHLHPDAPDAARDAALWA